MFADELLARRLHAQNREFFVGLAPAVRRAIPDIDEPCLDLEGSVAFFAGDGSPITQASGALTAEHLDKIAAFFKGRATSWEAILTPFAGPQALQRVLDLGAKVEGWESALYLPADPSLPPYRQPSEIEITEVGPENLAIWSEISRRGFFGDEPTAMSLTLARILEEADHIRRYLARWDGVPAGAASTTPGAGVAFLGGMATLPEYRGRGIQTALIRRRIEDAREDADLITIGAIPGTSSHRNAERVGFRVAFSQLSLRVPA